jgi:hypothetical protein
MNEAALSDRNASAQIQIEKDVAVPMRDGAS